MILTSFNKAASIDAGATLEFTGADSGSVTFNAATGMLKLDHSTAFTGQINGFTGDGTLAGSDQIDLKDIDLNSNSFSAIYNSATGVLEVKDGTNTADLKFNGTYVQANFKFASDGNGGTVVYDPPVTGDDTMSHYHAGELPRSHGSLDDQGLAIESQHEQKDTQGSDNSTADGHSFVFDSNMLRGSSEAFDLVRHELDHGAHRAETQRLQGLLGVDSHQLPQAWHHGLAADGVGQHDHHRAYHHDGALLP
jgi:hypothetical protein